MTDSAPSFEQFEQAARAEGFDEVVVRGWAPHVVLDNHSHPFALSAVVVRGELWLTVNGHERHLREGERFELARDVPHAERYGAQGATVWVARKHSEPL